MQIFVTYSDSSTKDTALKPTTRNASTFKDQKQRPSATVFVTPLSALQKHRKNRENLAGRSESAC